MQALEFVVKLLRAIWGAIGGIVTMYGLYFLLVPVTLVGGIALLSIAGILLLLVLLKQRIRVSMLVIAMVIAVGCTLAAPLAIPGRVYVAQCEHVSFDCVVAKQVHLGEATATIFPVADPVKLAVMERISASRPRFRSLPTTTTPEGVYLVHAPLERVLSMLSFAPDDHGSLGTIDLPGMLSEFSTSIVYNTESARIGGELAFAAGFSPTAYSFVVGRFASSPGFFGARSQNPPGFEQWREAVIGDLMLEALLRQDTLALDSALTTADPDDSRRAALRRDLLHYQIDPGALYGTVFSFQSLMDGREILANHRQTIDALSQDDPVYIEALQLISWPLFQTPDEDASDIDKALFRGQYDYYRALFSEEFSWSTEALPHALSNQRLNERLDEVDAQIEDQRLNDYFTQHADLDINDPADLAEALRGYMGIVFGNPEETAEERELAALLTAENYDEIDRRIEIVAPEARARAVWRLMEVMEGQVLLLATNLMVAAQSGEAANAEAPIAPITRWQELVHGWSRREAPMVREVLDARAEKLSSVLQLWEVMRRMLATAGEESGQTEAAREEAAMREFGRLGDVVQDRWFVPMIMEIGSSFERSQSDQIGAMQAAILQRCQAEDPSPQQLSVLGYLLLDTASLTPGSRISQEVRDCMWATFGREGRHADYWTGVAITRGLMLVANDTRLLEVNRAMLASVGGDPPWMLVMLSRMGRSNEALTEDIGPGADNWRRLVARYAPTVH